MTSIFRKRIWLAIIFLCLSTAVFASELDDLRKSALQGDAEAQFSLGVAYDKSEGVPRDYREAYIWYSLAVASGSDNKNAIIYRDEAEQKLSLAEQSEAQKETERRWKEIAERQANPVTVGDVPTKDQFRKIIHTCSFLAYRKDKESYLDFEETLKSCLFRAFDRFKILTTKEGDQVTRSTRGTEFVDRCVSTNAEAKSSQSIKAKRELGNCLRGGIENIGNLTQKTLHPR
ncbi:MAG: tetratricopeptide repeat protein [Pseudomonadales bacterium]